jgi:TonB family protein
MWGMRIAVIFAAGIALSGIAQGANRLNSISADRTQHQWVCHGGGGGGGAHGSSHPVWIYIPGVVVTQSSSPQSSADDHPPKIDTSYPHPPPPYPETAQLSGEQGSVVLRVKVGSEGRVRNVKIAKTSGFDDLDNAAVEGVLRWRFTPAVENGDTKTEWTDITVAYQLPPLTQDVPAQPQSASTPPAQ